MKKTLLFFALLCAIPVWGQHVFTQQFQSSITGYTRTLRVCLPQSYGTQTQQKYPLIFCFDGDYVFYAATGTLITMHYTETVPEAIVVGIDQNLEMPDKDKYFRWVDGDYTKKGTLDSSGILFRDMLFKEIYPMLDSTYRLSPYKVLVGHSYTATLASLLFMEPQSPFSAYMAVSPYLPTYVNQRLVNYASELSNPQYLYTSFGGNDLSGHISSGQQTKEDLMGVSNPNFHFKSDSVTEATHYSLIYAELSKGFTFVFEPIAKLDWNQFEQYLTLEKPLDWYETRMKQQVALTGNPEQPNLDDLYLLAYVASESADWPTMITIGEYAVTHFPNHVYGYYILGDAYMELQQYEQALNQYTVGYGWLDETTANKSDFYESIEQAQAKLDESK